MTALPITSSDPVIPVAAPVADRPRASSSNRQGQRVDNDAPPDAAPAPDQKTELPNAPDQPVQSPAQQKQRAAANRGTVRTGKRPKGQARAGLAANKKSRRKSTHPQVANEISATIDDRASLVPFSEVISKFASPGVAVEGTKKESSGKASGPSAPGDKIVSLDVGTPVAHRLRGVMQAGPGGSAPAGQPATRVASEAATTTHDDSQQHETLAKATGHEAHPTVPVTAALPKSTAAPGPETGQTFQGDPTGANRQITPQAIEGGQAALTSVQPKSVVGAEIVARADDGATEAGPGVVQPARPRLSSRHPADATVEVESGGGRKALRQTAANSAQSPAHSQSPASSQSPAHSQSPLPAAGNVDSVSPGGNPPQVPSPARPSWPVAAHQVTEQVRLARPQVGQRVVVRLNPPELGQVRLTLRGGRGGIRGTLEVDSSRTLAELRIATPPMIERLAESGIQLRNLDLVLSRQNQGNSPDASSSSLRDGALTHQQQQDKGGQAQGGHARQGDSAEASGEGAPARTGPVYVSDDSINVWI